MKEELKINYKDLINSLTKKKEFLKKKVLDEIKMKKFKKFWKFFMLLEEKIDISKINKCLRI